MPVRVYEDLGKAFNNHKRMSARKAGADALNTIQTRLRADNRGRIDKDKRFRFEQQMRKDRAAETERQRKMAAAEEEKRQDDVRRATLRAEYAAYQERTDYRNMPKVHYTKPVAQAKPSYMETLRKLFPPIEDHEERYKHREAILTNMLGPERMKLGVGLPSGHTGIEQEPTLVEYNRERRINETLELHREYQLQQRRQAEELQRKEQAQEEERIRKLVILQQAGIIYEGRVMKLAQFGSTMDAQLTKMLAAIENSDYVSLERAITALVSHVLEPAKDIYAEMDREIKLESLGADTLKSAWPLATIDKVLKTFIAPNLSFFNDSYQAAIGYMLQNLRAIC
jgi:hypothetical protein